MEMGISFVTHHIFLCKIPYILSNIINIESKICSNELYIKSKEFSKLSMKVILMETATVEYG